jgi:hypothetical protein
MTYTAKAKLKMMYWHLFGVPCYACKKRMIADERVYRDKQLFWEHRVCGCGASEGEYYPRFIKEWK